MQVKKIYSHHENARKQSLYVKKSDKPIDTCEIFNQKDLILIGISLGNSYFNEQRIRLILSGFCLKFKRIAVLLADELTIHNYRAVGYDEEKIQKKIRSESNHSRNRLKRVIDEVEAKFNRKNIEFYQWRDVESFSKYHDSLSVVNDHYNNENLFAHDVNQFVLKIINSNSSDCEAKNLMLDEAKWYLLKEIAFLHCASAFFGSSFVSGYYTDFPLFENQVFKNLIRRSNQISFVIYECREDD